MNNSLPVLRGLLLTASLIVGCGTGSTPPNSIVKTVESKSAFPIETRIELGVIAKGDSAHTSQWIRNPTDRAIHVAKIEKRCECLDVTFSNSDITSKGRSLIHLSYDGAKEPDFVGGLEIGVTLFDTDGKEIGKIQVPIEVVPSNVFNP